MKRFFLGAVFALLPVIGQADQLSLAQISQYLNALTTAKADFRQINDDGSISTGTLYISRPGQMRFEYDAPNNALVIASAQAVRIIDRKSNQPAETYPLSRTPLSLILDRNINLARDRMVTGHAYDGTATIVTAQDPRRPETGLIRMRFTDAPVTLQDWIIEDASGGQTQIVLGELDTGLNLPSSLFDASRELPNRER